MKLLIPILALILLSVIAFKYFESKPVSVRAFDHTLCMYPDRLDNPEDGCNNQDPACPENVVKGEEDCK